MTPEECVKIGGHCYELQDYVLCSYPSQSVRICKHCGHKQIGHAQDSIRWQDWPVVQYGRGSRVKD